MAMMLTEKEAYLKFILYGKSGTGKTTAATTAPNPLFLLSERQGYMSVQAAARNRGIPTPPVIYLEEAADLRKCMAHLRVGGANVIPRILVDLFGDNKSTKKLIKQLPYTEPQTVVADSFTDFCRLVSDDIRSSIKATASDGQEVRNDRYWDLMRGRGERLMVAMRDLPYHAVMLCLLDDRMTGEKKEERTRQVAPETPMRNLSSHLLACSNACGTTMKWSQLVKDKEGKAVMDEEGDAQYEHTFLVRFQGPNFMTLKTIEPLKEYEEPDVSDWITRILGASSSQGTGTNDEDDEQAEQEEEEGVQ